MIEIYSPHDCDVMSIDKTFYFTHWTVQNSKATSYMKLYRYSSLENYFVNLILVSLNNITHTHTQ